MEEKNTHFKYGTKCFGRRQSRYPLSIFPEGREREREKPRNIIPALINPHHMKLKWIMDSPGNHHPEPNFAHIALSHP